MFELAKNKAELAYLSEQMPWPRAVIYNFYFIKAFIHSFITEIYIAPLQDYYSESLPNLARLKRRVLRLE